MNTDKRKNAPGQGRPAMANKKLPLVAKVDPELLNWVNDQDETKTNIVIEALELLRAQSINKKGRTSDIVRPKR